MSCTDTNMSLPRVSYYEVHKLDTRHVSHVLNRPTTIPGRTLASITERLFNRLAGPPNRRYNQLKAQDRIALLRQLSTSVASHGTTYLFNSPWRRILCNSTYYNFLGFVSWGRDGYTVHRSHRVFHMQIEDVVACIKTSQFPKFCAEAVIFRLRYVSDLHVVRLSNSHE